MKIAMFTNNYLPNPYGVTGSIESFRKEFEKMGHEVYIFAPHFKGYTDETRNVFRYPSINTNFKINFPLAIPFSHRIDKILDSLEIDIIHSQHPNLLGSSAKKWAKKKKVPLIFTWHTLYDKYAHFVPFIPSFLAAKWAIKNAVKYANICDQVIVPTKSVEDIVINWGVKDKNIEAIQTGIDENLFANADRDAIRKKYGIKDDEVLLLVVTRFTDEKNVEFLFRAVAKVLKKSEKVKFLAGGEGNLAGVLNEYVKKEGLEEKVIFPGFVSADIKKDYYAAADTFVWSSKSETQGLVFTEAMCSGVPVVAVDSTGSRDMIKNNVTGFLIKEDEDEFANAVIKLAESKELRKEFGENAKKIAREKYTSSVCASEMLSIYQKAIERKKL